MLIDSLHTRLPLLLATKMDSLFSLAAFGIVFVPIVYWFVARLVQSRLPQLHGKRICLLIAHPDDEAMFFAPTVLSLTRPETGNHVKILCLSTGNADGLGETRKKELIKSGICLGSGARTISLSWTTSTALAQPRLRRRPATGFSELIPVSKSRHDFPDSLTTKWDHQKISALLCSAVAPNLARQRASPDTAPTSSIDVIVTFDNSGISSHPNHISLYHGARTFISALVEGKSKFPCPVDLYTLTSVNFFRKYSSIADALTTLIFWAIGPKNDDEDHPKNLVLMNTLFGEGASRGTACKAMADAHKSQMVWFRGWIFLSRYMMINELRLEHVERASSASRN
ncbi:unnamed protein product [Clonostachys rhizophaga]|uniref:N-acetylglucosaminylphosphatidylinositol deacetylase n=1 Tax=Clonostachys rhizophaga TaxID=160324 RepID=A0A9N9V2X6_9HYPO|nr:unnamed protein product [Clonostachys rhizophaga]